MASLLKKVGNYQRAGLRYWIIQRVSGIYMFFYIIGAIATYCLYSNLDYETYQHLLAMRIVRITTLLFLVSIISHSWIGMWTIATDYIKKGILRNTYYAAIIMILLVYLVWGIEIIWRIH